MSGQLVEQTGYGGRGDVPFVKTSAVVMGRDQIDMFHVMCLLAGRNPHQYAADVLLEAIREAQADPAKQRLVRIIRRARSKLRLVDCGADAESGVDAGTGAVFTAGTGGGGA
jgi:hypothetical protein